MTNRCWGQSAVMYDFVVFAFLLSIVVGGGIGGWLVFRHDVSSSAFAFGLFMLLSGFWSATHVGTLSSSTQFWLLLYTKLSYVCVVTAPIVWLAFALRYRDRADLLSKRRLGLLSIVPVVTLVAVFTAEHHTLFYTSMTVTDVAGRPLLATGSGVFHSVNIVYSYTILLIGTGLLVQSAFADNRLYRHQSYLLLTCLLFPWFANAAYHVGIRPIPWVDPTPMAFTIVGAPLAVFVVRTDLTSFLPVAHRRMFRTLEDPIIVVTPDGRVLDSNFAARSIFGDGDGLDSSHVTEVLPDTLLEGNTLREDLDSAVECTLYHDGETRHFLARRREIEPGNDTPSRGSLVSLTDITVQKGQQQSLERKTDALEEQTSRLERKNEQLERLADVISHDMRAPLSTADKLTTLLQSDLGTADPAVQQLLTDLESVHGRLQSFADHLPQLARESTDVETTDNCDLQELATDAWTVVETGDVTLHVEETTTLQADHRRLQQVFENLFSNAVEHGASDDPSIGNTADDRFDAATAGEEPQPFTRGGSDVEEQSGFASYVPGEDAPARTAVSDVEDGVETVRVGVFDGGFYVEDDGPGIPLDRREAVFEYGVSSGEGSGFGLAIARTIVEAHGWEIEVLDGEEGGARFEIRTER